jgi:hypothetical protein
MGLLTTGANIKMVAAFGAWKMLLGLFMHMLP